MLQIKDLKNLPVYTERNIYLGKVTKVKLDKFSNNIEKIFVKPSNIVERIFKGELEISQNQIISIEKDKIIVKDLKGELKKPIFEPIYE